MDSKLHILQHSLGLDQYGGGNQYRNHFCTGPGSKDFDDCRALVADGLMTERAGNALSGGDSVFYVTPKGIDYVALNSPTRPPEPKLPPARRVEMTKDEWITRCAARYQERAGLTPEEAKAAAKACFDAESGETEFSEAVEYHPEDCADEDMACWTDDGE